ncbi:16S rRNA (guanine(527)-N(7))-methyltransferase RsmG [Vitreoscilla massiliensis]|uniref:Ribosomal RNA small subunit methyltransferase G n=1 Tax=Vitreoscilla massiliensis TaxID=1689272 RepID=A0ABY4DZH4_9NEIS|nr:16S rRNA (guanine(527)-N(7))-methyltransferase RsmG [Vitreoscilla massiliensis]UOO87930.1 16S rRNA (guanine(527)-N(7))-methyltransferase RsmG [Vitreoscilla massiliensis]
MSLALPYLQMGLQQMQIELSAEQQQKLLDYVALLLKWNSTYNLTALRQEDQMLSHHVLDSLTLLPYLDGVAQLIDVGSGGGMPGIPTAICRPDIQITLLDSNSKKTSFLSQAVIELGLSNVKVITGRVEAVEGIEFDAITSRAFAELRDFVTLTSQLLRVDGRWLAMKGVHPYEEIAQLPEDVHVAQVDKLTVPSLEAERHMVIIQKGASA